MGARLLLAGLVVVVSGCGSSGGTPSADAGASASSDGGMDAATTLDATVAPDAEGNDAAVLPLPACGTSTPEALMACVERARYVADLETISGARPPGSTHHGEVRELCATRLGELGFTVERHDYGSGVNVVGTRVGTALPDERVLVSAHYDSTVGCPGADDNASGTAGALETARVLAMATFGRTLVVACWDEEERGLVGSRGYADRAAMRGETLVANFVYEMIGYRDTTPGSQSLPAGLGLLFPRELRALQLRGSPGDFVVVIADELHSAGSAAAVGAMAARVGLPSVVLALPESVALVPETSDLRRSDHASFWENGAPGIMLGDTANFRYDRYHCAAGPDTPDQLDPDFSVAIIQATVGAAAQSLQAP